MNDRTKFFWTVCAVVVGIPLFIFGIFTSAATIAEQDFPRFVHVVGIVHQPNPRTKTLVVKVRNTATFFQTTRKMAVVCRGDAPQRVNPAWEWGNGQIVGARQVYFQFLALESGVGAGDTKDITLDTSDIIILDRATLMRECFAGVNARQARYLAGTSPNQTGTHWSASPAVVTVWNPARNELPPE